MSEAFDIRIGHVLDVLRHMPDESIHCCVTSPPYWGLRNYGIPDQVWGGDMGHRHVWTSQPTVRKGSTNGRSDLGSTLVSIDATKTIAPGLDNTIGETKQYRSDSSSFCECGAWRGGLGLEPSPYLFVEHLVLIFQEIRRVLRPDGTCWLNLGDSYNAQPGQRKTTDPAGPKQTTNEGAQGTPSRSVAGLKPKDLIGIPWRCALALQEDGWWLRSDIIWAKPAPMPESVTDRPTRSHEYVFLLAKSQKYFYDHEAIKEPSVCAHPSGNGYKRDSRLTYADSNGARGSDKPWVPRPSAEKGAFGGKTEAMADTGQNAFRAVTQMRNKRDVWTINTQPTPEAHFATYPVALAETCILAGCPAGGIVLDPFSGAGTTGLAAIKHGRQYIGIELNPAYAKITTDRTDRHAPLFA